MGGSRARIFPHGGNMMTFAVVAGLGLGGCEAYPGVFAAFGLLEKARWLESEDLYYVGFHFAEQAGRAQAFGGRVLQLVVGRSPKSKLAQAAKSKLKREGLG